MAEQLKEHIKDPGSAITHFIGMLMAIFAAIPLLLKAAREPSKIYIIAIAVYAASLILLYAASTTYHTFDKSKKVNTILKKIDHMMISVLIAGSYTRYQRCNKRRTAHRHIGRKRSQTESCTRRHREISRRQLRHTDRKAAI